MQRLDLVLFASHDRIQYIEGNLRLLARPGAELTFEVRQEGADFVVG